jgi:hypothetical protein
MKSTLKTTKLIFFSLFFHKNFSQIECNPKLIIEKNRINDKKEGQPFETSIKLRNLCPKTRITNSYVIVESEYALSSTKRTKHQTIKKSVTHWQQLFGNIIEFFVGFLFNIAFLSPLIESWKSWNLKHFHLYSYINISLFEPFFCTRITSNCN